MKKAAYYVVLCVLMFLAVPYIITGLMGNSPVGVVDGKSTPDAAESKNIAVFDSDFEKYIAGVVAAEMPALYNIEALKAQAVASRTYAVNAVQRTGDSDYTKVGQAYIDESEMKSRWGENFDTYYSKIANAVTETKNEIMVYEGEPIVADFHALSAGKTENSQDVWKEELPYLKSVDSSFDQLAENFEQLEYFTGDEFITKLRQEYPDLVFDKGDIIEQIKINERTEAGYVKNIIIGNKIMDGSTLRRILNLRSTNFTVYRDMDKIVFDVKGYGHGAGMSQVGANYLAGQGYDYKSILKHYYSGVEFGLIK